MVLPESVESVIGFQLLGVPVGRYAVALGVLVLALLVRRTLLSQVEKRISRREKREAEEEIEHRPASFDEESARDPDGRRRNAMRYLRSGVRRAARPLGLAIIILGFYFALEIVSLPPGISLWTGRLFLALIVVDVMWFLFGLVDGAA